MSEFGFLGVKDPNKNQQTSYWCVYCMKSYSKLTEALLSELISDHTNVHFFPVNASRLSGPLSYHIENESKLRTSDRYGLAHVSDFGL